MIWPAFKLPRASHTASYRRWALLPASLLLVVLILSSPLASGPWRLPSPSGLLDLRDQGWLRPIIRSWAFSLATVVIALPTAFFGATAIWRASDRMARALPLLLVPFFVGAVASGFVFKLVFQQRFLSLASLAERQFAATWTLALVARCWQFIPLAAFLFCLRLRSMPPGARVFTSTSRLAWDEAVRDVYWPHCRELGRLLALLCLIDSIQEFGTFALLFQPSPGTGTELVSHRLLRFYREYAQLDYGYAVRGVLAYSSVFILAGVLILPALTSVAISGMDRAVRLIPRLIGWKRRSATSVARSGGSGSNLVVALAVILTLIPLSVLAGNLPSLRTISSVFTSRFLVFASLSAVATLACLLLSFGFSAATRVAFPEHTERFRARSVALFVGLLSFRLVPPVGLVFALFFWLERLHSRGVATGQAAWILAETILLFPLLTIFLQYVHFGVKSAEIQFHRLARASFSEVLKRSFLARFPVDYVLAALFAFTLIWQEDAMSAMLSGSVGSIAVELTQRVSGRAGDYEQAVALLLVSLVPPLLGVLMWRRTVVSNATNRVG